MNLLGTILFKSPLYHILGMGTGDNFLCLEISTFSLTLFHAGYRYDLFLFTNVLSGPTV